jgi:hypothetical protein
MNAGGDLQDMIDPGKRGLASVREEPASRVWQDLAIGTRRHL